MNNQEELHFSELIQYISNNNIEMIFENILDIDIEENDNNVVHFNIEFIIIENKEKNKNYFKNCKEIDEVISKPSKIKKDCQLLNEECLICLENYKINELKRSMEPSCIHYFHKKCIDKWLKKKGDCPICRKKIK